MSSSPLMSQPFHEWLSLVLRQDDFILIPVDLALVVQVLDSSERLSHVSLPDKSSRIKEAELWHIKAWRRAEERIAKAREEHAQDQIAIENLKYNWHAISIALSEIVFEGIKAPDECEDMAVEVISKNPNATELLGVKLRLPFYKKPFDVLPFRNRRKDIGV